MIILYNLSFLTIKIFEFVVFNSSLVSKSVILHSLSNQLHWLSKFVILQIILHWLSKFVTLLLHNTQVYVGAYRNPNSIIRSVISEESIDTIEKGQLVALNVENCHLKPLIAKVLEVNEETIDVVWLEGSYSKAWKVAKKKEGRDLVDWIDTVPKSSVILFDFQLTRSDRLRKATIKHLKAAYTKLNH